MKKSANTTSAPARAAGNNQHGDIRSNLDSRKNTEQQVKNTDITHNRKAVKSAKPRSH